MRAEGEAECIAAVIIPLLCRPCDKVAPFARTWEVGHEAILVQQNPSQAIEWATLQHFDRQESHIDAIAVRELNVVGVATVAAAGSVDLILNLLNDHRYSKVGNNASLFSEWFNARDKVENIVVLEYILLCIRVDPRPVYHYRPNAVIGLGKAED